MLKDLIFIFICKQLVRYIISLSLIVDLVICLQQFIGNSTVFTENNICFSATKRWKSWVNKLGCCCPEYLGKQEGALFCLTLHGPLTYMLRHAIEYTHSLDTYIYCIFLYIIVAMRKLKLQEEEDSKQMQYVKDVVKRSKKQLQMRFLVKLGRGARKPPSKENYSVYPLENWKLMLIDFWLFGKCAIWD